MKQNLMNDNVDELDEFNAIVGTAVLPKKAMEPPRQLKASWSFEAAPDLMSEYEPIGG